MQSSNRAPVVGSQSTATPIAVGTKVLLAILDTRPGCLPLPPTPHPQAPGHYSDLTCGKLYSGKGTLYVASES